MRSRALSQRILRESRATRTQQKPTSQPKSSCQRLSIFAAIAALPGAAFAGAAFAVAAFAGAAGLAALAGAVCAGAAVAGAAFAGAAFAGPAGEANLG